MLPIVLQLQHDALDRDVPTSDLLRKAFVVAKKLKLNDFENWIDGELNGYNLRKVPDYRRVTGQIKGWNPYQGWIPLLFQDSELERTASRSLVHQSIAELHHLVHSSPGTSLEIPFPANIQMELSRGFGFETKVHLHITKAAIVRIFEAVRTAVLDWSLQLESAGILGEGLSFSSKEQEMAKRNQNIVTNFFGTVHNPQLQHGNDVALQNSGQISIELVKSVVESVSGILPTIRGEQAAELEAELATLKAQISSPKPKQGVLRESLKSIRTILEAAAGGAAGQIVFEIGKMLA